MKPFEIFRAGRQIDDAGVVHEITAEDLAASAAAYDPAKHEAPLTIGHPASDRPAWGWVKRVVPGQPALVAEPGGVQPQFEEWVSKGFWKKRSAAFYPPSSPHNPVPGVWYLRHVAFLGAQPPAVKGMADVQFAASAEGTVSFSERSEYTTARLFRRLRDWLIGDRGLEAADQVLSEWDVAALEDEARRAQDATPGFAETPPAVPGKNTPCDAPQAPGPGNVKGAAPVEAAPAPAVAPHPSQIQETPVTPEQAAALQTENAALLARLAALEASQARQAADLRHQVNASFAEGLVAAGTLAPRHRDAVVAVLDHLAAAPQPVQFGEGEGAVPLLDAFRAALSDSAPVVQFGEVATAGRAAGVGAGQVSDAEIARRARKWKDEQAQAGGSVSFAEAVDHVRAEIASPAARA